MYLAVGKNKADSDKRGFCEKTRETGCLFPMGYGDNEHNRCQKAENNLKKPKKIKNLLSIRGGLWYDKLSKREDE